MITLFHQKTFKLEVSESLKWYLLHETVNTLVCWLSIHLIDGTFKFEKI
jgi:hypothetical protein